jgi:hypothetical protein
MTFAHLKPTVATLSRIIDRSGQRPREAVRARLRALLSAPAGQHRGAAGRPQHPPRRPADAMADALRPLGGAFGCGATTGPPSRSSRARWSSRRMASLRPPLSLRRLHGITQPDTDRHQPGSATGPAHGMSAPLADPHTVKITYITERDAYPGASKITPPA